MNEEKDVKASKASKETNHPSDYVNFGRASLCSTAFLGLYMALYSAQNVQS
jgi:hypothetical protein